METYHHGSLRAELLGLAAETLESSGVHALSLRDLARRAGVSHAAPIHHFGTRTGLLTELARQGFEGLAAVLSDAGDDLYDAGVAYVRWGVGHPGLYGVMWQTELLDRTHEPLERARRDAWHHLERCLGPSTEARRTDALAAFALVHGVVQLILSGAEPRIQDDEASLRDLLRRLTPAS
ncbi:TetR/AcrR family transcriptional regulator [Actinotalea sp. C106]|uniref:TetR/AcrR family transcriptional regulator n=1 Tax=Actinotalea sp. C106 TaxID=2908644 RepID=UPI002028CBD8|nr:TetR/AcrR family transcriptional regulator [Actinotalea sp. C106]